MENGEKILSFSLLEYIYFYIYIYSGIFFLFFNFILAKTEVAASQQGTKIQSKTVLVHMFEMDYQECIVFFPTFLLGGARKVIPPSHP